ncbi:cysteine-rich CWC family protein [Paraglaciecola marina]|uniref:cysteine-rich CWC family protein n=1 Tax=Paraglaciecola marina TaxID=2500157 RepID=UPI0023B26B78|nr:cysteine-rich CWC family protein [Paraglaciecola marina]
MCHKANECSAELGSCWCFNTSIPAGLKAQLNENVDPRCICQSCVAIYNNAPEKFTFKS